MYRSPIIYDLCMSLPFLNIQYSTQMKIVSKMIGRNKKVFDVACGTGNLSRFLDKSNQYQGIDLNEKFVKYARGKGLQVAKADIFNKDSYPKIIDFIIISHTLHHVSPLEKKLISLAQKHAKKVIVVEGINDSWTSVWWNKFIGKFEDLFNLIGDADGINKNNNIKTALLSNTYPRLEKLFNSLGGRSQEIPGGIIGIFDILTS